MEQRIALPYLDEFLLYLKTQNYSTETSYNYERDLRQFEVFLGDEAVQFDSVNKQTILHYKAYLVSRDRKQPLTGVVGGRKLAPGSINRTLSSLRMFLKYMVDMDRNVPVPPDAIKLVKTDKKHPQVAELSELIKLIEYPERAEKNKLVGLRNRTMLEVLLSTGMRISELVSLNKNQLDDTGRL